ncbi:hypothetical protein Adt_19023 [Abeliophyllum distichum]|uniref:Uncharacterized protein n=1 Tax=Abeliophyllum distichum TaxID=126358 RepID=A0ABD1TLI2_9LAMI
MVRLDSGNCPTFCEIMADDLDVWDSDSESEDEIDDGCSTFISKKKKYRSSNKKGKKYYVSLTGLILGEWSKEVQSIEEVSTEESQRVWTLMKRCHQKDPQLPSPEYP